MYFLQSHKGWLAIFILALAARFLFLGISLYAHPGQFIDTISGSDCYYVLSENILSGHGYSCDEVAPYTLNSIRPPVFPYFLAFLHIVGGSYWLPLIVQILLGSLVPLLGMLLAQHITNKKRVIYGVGVLLALDPNSILFSTIFYSETLFTVLFLTSLLYFFEFLRKSNDTFQTFSMSQVWVLSSSAFLLGLATLSKPTAEYVAIIFVGIIFWQSHVKSKSMGSRPRFSTYGVVFFVVFMLTLSPWLYRNYHEFGVVGVSPQLGEQLYAVLVPSVLSFENHTTFGSEFTHMLEEGSVDPNKASVAHGSEYLHKAVPILLAHPYGFAVISANTALNFFIHDGFLEVLKHAGIRPTQKLGSPALFLFLTHPIRLLTFIGSVVFTPFILVLFARLISIGITLATFLGMVRYMRREENTTRGVAAIAIIFYFMLTTLVIGLAVTARYRVPIEALILIFALYEMSNWRRVRWGS